MALTDPLIGRMLGDYRVIDILGRGGMARVYRGYDPKLERYAAIKIIDAHLLSNQESEEEYRARFRREARSIARLNHPNIVGIYQYGEVDALYYMAMVFIEGRDLGQILKDYIGRGARMPLSQVLRIVSDTGAALDYAHQGGVIHRDVKPSNIMVTNDGRAVLTDFGLALSVPEGSIGNTFGSAHYIAPEQAVSSAQAVPQSDLYSLAIVLYQMLTGKVPFDDPSAMSVALKHISEPPPPLSRYVADIPLEVELVVQKALEKDIRLRYPTGKAFVDALAAAFAPMLNSESKMRALSESRPRALTDTSGQSLLRRMKTEELEKIDGATFRTSPFPPLNADTRPTWSEKINLAAAQAGTTSTQNALRGRDEPTDTPEARRGSRLLPRLAVVLAIIALAAAGLFLLNESRRDSGGIGVAAGTDDPSQRITDAPTDTLQPTVTVAEPTPDTTGTAAALAAVQPTAESITVTAGMTDTPSPRPPTRTPTIPGGETMPTDSTPAAAVTNSTADQPTLLLEYDAQSLLLRNISAQSIDISAITFVRLNQLGAQIIFRASDWDPVSGQSYRLPADGCYQVWLISMPFREVPPECVARFGWEAVGTARQFWISSEPDQTFEVRRGNRTLATCPTNGGRCEVLIDP
ncbi:MAG: serine/threonine-protein kinase [bacterium]|nr:serine/threonine-protein kinase [bacterium]